MTGSLAHQLPMVPVATCLVQLEAARISRLMLPGRCPPHHILPHPSKVHQLQQCAPHMHSTYTWLSTQSIDTHSP
jgi:hypothetical protein